MLLDEGDVSSDELERLKKAIAHAEATQKFEAVEGER
jgi:hypothetical protein